MIWKVILSVLGLLIPEAWSIIFLDLGFSRPMVCIMLSIINTIILAVELGAWKLVVVRTINWLLSFLNKILILVGVKRKRDNNKKNGRFTSFLDRIDEKYGQRWPAVRYAILAILTLVPGLQKFGIAFGDTTKTRYWFWWVCLCGVIRMTLVVYGVNNLFLK